MQTLDLTLLVKTFMRPECLDNFLNSIAEYQSEWNLKFADVVIVDDSDEEYNEKNVDVINKYQDVNITYKHYEFNSLGLSKGRNIGLELIKTEYFVYCDDDFLLDKNCGLKYVLDMAKNNNLDVLAGYYKNLRSLDSNKIKNLNWIGFIQENDEFDVCTIYENLFPEFLKCDIVQNFYIGKTESIKKVGYPEDIHTNEHNLVFLRFKQNGLKVYSTSKLYVRHLHLKKENKKYKTNRSRFFEKQMSKPVVGQLITENCIYTFKDYFTGSAEKFVNINDNKKYRFKLNLLICKIDVYMSLFKTIDKLLKKYKSTLKKLCPKYWIKREKLNKFKAEYPTVMSTTETLEKLINEHKSIARFGDGEFKMVISYLDGEKQENSLSEKLNEILSTPTESCITAIAKYHDEFDDTPNYKNGFSYWENYWLENGEKFKKIFLKDYTYGCSTITRSSVFKENPLSKVKELWNNKKVLFVIGDGSHWVDEPRLFDNIAQKEYLITKSENTFDEYDNIISGIRKYDKDWLIMAALGATATVLAYELSKEGYQVIDVGHLPNCYLQAIGERQSPEIEHFKNKVFKIK